MQTFFGTIECTDKFNGPVILSLAHTHTNKQEKVRGKGKDRKHKK